MTESSEGANQANTIWGLKKFDGRNPAEFKTWMKKLCVVISVTRRDILPLLKGTARPTHTSNIAEYNRANEDLYAMLFLLVELPASLCVQKRENDDEISGDGQAAFKELCNTYDKVTDEVIRATMEELVNTPMEPGQNPDDYFNQKRLLRIRAEKMGEHISNRYFKDICVTGFTDNYKDVKMMMYRDPSFDVDQMQTTMRHMFLDEQSRNWTKGRIAGRGSAVTAVTSEQDIICYWCKNRGHSKKDCPKFKSRTKPAGEAKWCSVHRTTTHRNGECHSQGATRPTKNASVSLACTNCRHCTSTDSKEPTVDNTEPSHSDKPVINFAGSSDDFDGGFMYAAGCRDASPLVPRVQLYWLIAARRNPSSTTSSSRTSRLGCENLKPYRRHERSRQLENTPSTASGLASSLLPSATTTVPSSQSTCARWWYPDSAETSLHQLLN